MESTPLVRILRALPAESLRALDKFMHSPYWVTHAEELRLYAELRSCLSGPTEHIPSPEALMKLLQCNRERLYHLSSYLLQSVERFLACQTWQQDEHAMQPLVIESLRHLQLDELGTRKLRQSRKKLEAAPAQGIDYYRSDYRLQLEAFHLSQQQGRTRSFKLQELSDAQDIAFICEKLRTGCILLSHQAVVQNQYNAGLLEPVLRFLKGHPYLRIPVLAGYYHGYYAQSGGKDAEWHFQRLKDLLEAPDSRLDAAEVHDLYLMAINFCIRRLNLREEHYFRYALELYQSGLERGALLESGKLSRWTYTNINLTALHEQAYDWAFAFLHHYRDLLPENHREGVFNFNLARYYYATGDYSQAMPLLLRREYDDILQNLVAKVLLCKMYFEQDEQDALENQLDSIQIYLRRKKVLGYHKEIYSTFIRMMRRLLSLVPGKSGDLTQFRQQVETEPRLTEREWFLQQLNGFH